MSRSAPMLKKYSREKIYSISNQNDTSDLLFEKSGIILWYTEKPDLIRVRNIISKFIHREAKETMSTSRKITSKTVAVLLESFGLMINDQ